MPRLAKLDWTPVDVTASKPNVQRAFAAYEKARQELEAAVTTNLDKAGKVDKGHKVKIGLMFNKLSYAIVPESGATMGKAQGI